MGSEFNVRAEDSAFFTKTALRYTEISVVLLSD